MPMIFRARWLLATALVSAIASPLAGCGPRVIEAHPAKPLPPPKVAVPDFMKVCPPIPSWLSAILICRPAPPP